MCLIIHAEPKYRISAELMANFATRNDDGFGVMWIENNKIRGAKFGPNDMDELYPTYELLQDREHFIHLRMRTHGDTSKNMAHPYYCGYGIWLMHNGILSSAQGEDKSKSDTWYFINDVLNPLFKACSNPHELMRSQVFARIMEEYLGTGNRIVMGDRGGYVMFNTSTWHTITNEATGVQGMLVSNTYAWDAYGFGKPKVYTHNNVTSFRGAQRSLPLVQGTTESRGTTTIVGDGSPCPEHEKALMSWFFFLGRHWYVDKYSHIYRRTERGFERRVDLDEKDQFWNTFDADTICNAGVWMAEQNNVEADAVDAVHSDPLDNSNDEVEVPTVCASPETIDITTGEISQLVINWAAMNEKDIEKYLKKHPTRAAQALHHMTHNRQ